MQAKDTASDVKSAASDAGDKAQAAVPDVSLVSDEELGDPKKVADKVRSLLGALTVRCLGPLWPPAYIQLTLLLSQSLRSLPARWLCQWLVVPTCGKADCKAF